MLQGRYHRKESEEGGGGGGVVSYCGQDFNGSLKCPALRRNSIVPIVSLCGPISGGYNEFF